MSLREIGDPLQSKVGDELQCNRPSQNRSIGRETDQLDRVYDMCVSVGYKYLDYLCNA